MRILADENVPKMLVRMLRERGHDVLSAREDLCGQSDRALLDRAEAEARVIITQDKDFGELAVRHRLPATCGVILFRTLSPELRARVGLCPRCGGDIDPEVTTCGWCQRASTPEERVRAAPPPRQKADLAILAKNAGVVPKRWLLQPALGSGSGAELYRGLGFSTVGGLTLSTLVTLVLVPSLVALVWDFRIHLLGAESGAPPEAPLIVL